ncbi:type II toxin-antitoxin system RatA family toxin [Roseospira visakhapatnamensis]|uniref:Coenzyme Q-binding protein COQ10 n=1 Tax=Roseospira visakhapatnamensis TaxID=390880 RepID=A0A7W6RDQ1_9PROT|nr:SRPBCC family protein [Roseospira visakhapatnamensis]MBB4266445.1 coenzyme Q-binding protein COQ10 [Roseospira visakhapatnamensis]
MPHLTLHRDVGFPCPLVYDVIADVRRYPEFLPGFHAVRTDGHDGAALRVIQTVGGLGLTTTFLSHATFDRPHTIRIVSTDRPFRSLNQTWTLSERGPARTHVRLQADYALADRLAGVVFDRLYPGLLRGGLSALIRRVSAMHRANVGGSRVPRADTARGEAGR